ncbi:hypothetical protein [Sulfuritalea hydrogenivorans]|uniref:Uncharacterized protein n=1 Tax=Sulfuritalea hydrogenivorans sk43H TaxID=1223802 RepID=W0SDU6_9PROT|nr:hypothetical protein [Sulfuritalea hydrogenivorans]BAO29384.1 hypothetical protein SUTH_01591 [Sulfuritalea hydrogenivorans sk43H]
MRPECINAVQQAIGRTLNQQEIQGIEDRIKAMFPAARRTLQESGEAITSSSMLTKAGELAADQLRREAATLKQRVALTVKAHDRIAGFIDRAQTKGRKAYDGLGDAIHDADIYATGTARYFFSQLTDTIRAAQPRLLGMLENPAAVRDLVFEMFGHDTGNPIAQAGAKAWREVSEAMRQSFNAAGGMIRHLENWNLPQPHDALRVREAGVEKWVRSILPLIDRERYVHPDGRLFNDAELGDFFAHAWETIQSDGLNKLEPGVLSGHSARANRHADGRQIHFKGPEEYLAYHSDFGRGNIFDALQGHVSVMARDIALLETWGPNPEHLFRYFHDVAAKDGKPDRIWHGVLPVTTRQLWDNLSGKVAQMGEYAKLGEIAQGVRNIEVMGKLGKAMLSSTNDVQTFLTTLHYNRLPFFDGLTNFVRAFGDDAAEYANRAGLVADSVIADMNRWGENNVGRGWTARLANATMKASLLTAWTDAIRRAFSLTMMGGMGKITRLEWSALDAGDRYRMAAKGITEADWSIYRMAQLEDWRGSRMLTPESIKAVPLADLEAAGFQLGDRNKAISRLLGAIIDESEYASLGQDIYTRAQLNRGLQKGTIEGELARSVALFKGFPFAMVSRHWMRALEANEAGNSRIGYGASLALGLTLFGSLSLDLKDVQSGKDPRDKTDPRFWFQAFAQGGGASIFGDLLYAGLSGHGRGGQSGAATLASAIAGPVVGDAYELAGDLILENIRQAKEGRDTHAGAEALRFGLGHAPLINVWYIRAALDHAFLHQAQEFLSPNYLGRMQDRVYRDYGQDFYWRPGQTLPDRAPRLEAMAGR